MSTSKTQACPAASPQTVRRCILHFGLAKTGTTSVQNFLFANRAELLRRWRILYPGPESNHFHFQTMFAKRPADLIQVRRLGITEEQAARSFADACREAFEAELSEARPETLLVSSEYFPSMDDEELTALRDYLQSISQEVQLLVFVRDPWSFATSSAQQLVRDGMQKGPRYYGYGYYVVIVKRFEALFASKAIVRPYISLGQTRTDAIAEICTSLGIDRSVLAEADRQDNPGIGYVTAAILSRLNEVDGPLAADGTFTIDPIRDIAVTAILKNTTDHTSIRLSREVAEAIREQAADDLAWLRDRHFGGVCPFLDAYAKHRFEGGDDCLTIDHVRREDIIAVMFDALRQMTALYRENEDWGKSLYSDQLVGDAMEARRQGAVDRAAELLELALQMWPQNSRAAAALNDLRQPPSPAALSPVPTARPDGPSLRAATKAGAAILRKIRHRFRH